MRNIKMEMVFKKNRKKSGQNISIIILFHFILFIYDDYYYFIYILHLNN